MGETVTCVVCGQGSTRTDWQGKQGKAACDSHSQAEVQAALAKSKPVVEINKPVPATPTQSQPAPGASVAGAGVGTGPSLNPPPAAVPPVVK